mmetsp:Transcript_34555/g.109714  ORF Transcript_34555/g.109714 Transcript_34555/m.109714 type:complete len:112 (-) Transcript_34555:18-353(-)
MCGRFKRSASPAAIARPSGVPAAASVTALSTIITTGTTEVAESTEQPVKIAASACHGIAAKASAERLGTGAVSPPIDLSAGPGKRARPLAKAEDLRARSWLGALRLETGRL